MAKKELLADWEAYFQANQNRKELIHLPEEEVEAILWREFFYLISSFHTKRAD